MLKLIVQSEEDIRNKNATPQDGMFENLEKSFLDNRLKSFEVMWTKNAKYDLEEVIKYIKVDSIKVAKNIFSEIKEQCNDLAIFLLSRRIVPELQHIGILQYWELIYKMWGIVYKIEDEKVYILIVVDSSRDIEDILFRRLLKDDSKTSEALGEADVSSKTLED